MHYLTFAGYVITALITLALAVALVVWIGFSIFNHNRRKISRFILSVLAESTTTQGVLVSWAEERELCDEEDLYNVLDYLEEKKFIEVESDLLLTCFDDNEQGDLEVSITKKGRRELGRMTLLEKVLLKFKRKEKA